MWQYSDYIDSKRLEESYIGKHYNFILKISGLHPKMDDKNRIFSITQVMIYIFALVHQMVILIKLTFSLYECNMVLFSQNVHFCLLMQVALVVLISFLWNNLNISLLHSIMSVDFYDYQEPPMTGEEPLRSRMKMERRQFTIIPIGAALSAGVILTVSPIVDFKTGSFDFNSTASMFNYHLPYPYSKHPYYVEDGFGYYVAVSGQVACGIVLAAIIGGGGFMFINISGAFYLLENIFSIPVGSSYLTGTIVIALSLISAGSAKELPGTTVASMLLCAIEVGYMYLFSVIGQRFTDLSTELRSKVYNTRWYMCSGEIKSVMMIFQEKTLKPMALTAGKIVPANMETFTTVMNGAYSYYNLVNAFDEK